jgi:hypothetical protein
MVFVVVAPVSLGLVLHQPTFSAGVSAYLAKEGASRMMARMLALHRDAPNVASEVFAALTALLKRGEAEYGVDIADAKLAVVVRLDGHIDRAIGVATNVISECLPHVLPELPPPAAASSGGWIRARALASSLSLLATSCRCSRNSATLCLKKGVLHPVTAALLFCAHAVPSSSPLFAGISRADSWESYLRV